MRPLTTDLTNGHHRPYFFWDEDTSVDELRAVLLGPDGPERDRMLGKLLREARDTDVWQFVTPEQVAAALPGLSRHLGRRRGFWEYVMERWHALGLIK